MSQDQDRPLDLDGLERVARAAYEAEHPRAWDAFGDEFLPSVCLRLIAAARAEGAERAYKDGWRDCEAEFTQTANRIVGAEGAPAAEVLSDKLFTIFQECGNGRPINGGDLEVIEDAAIALSPPAAEGKEDGQLLFEIEQRAFGRTLGWSDLGPETQARWNGAAGAFRAALSHPAPAAEPVGDWVMVPREPTEAMIAAAVEGLGLPWREIQRVLEAYRRMVAASPPQQPVEISREELARTFAALLYDSRIGHQTDYSGRYWDALTQSQRNECYQHADAIISKLSGYPLVEGKQGGMASSSTVCGEGTLPSPSEPPRSAGGES